MGVLVLSYLYIFLGIKSQNMHLYVSYNCLLNFILGYEIFTGKKNIPKEKDGKKKSHED